MASVYRQGRFNTSEWTSRTYPFKVQLVGKRVFKGRALAGDRSWEGQGGQTGYITMDGTLQTLQFKVEGNHRPVRFVMYHTDGNFAPNSSNYNLDIYYYETAIGAPGTGGNELSRWERIGGGVVGAASHTEYAGETYERQTSEYRITFQGTSGHILFVAPYMQSLEDTWGSKRQ